MIASTAAALLALTAAAAPVPPAAAAALAVGVTTHTISSLYTGDRVRDPFLPASMGSGPSSRPTDEKEGSVVVDIHALQLRGLMKDSVADFAIFAGDAGQTFLLRAGRLYDGRNKPVPGVTGRIKIKQKRVELITADKDVQVFNLGETDEDKEKDRKP
ncbi:MAG TPA: hypothetical protein DCZ01_04570 [Elusimicrobia bacterium]|nr:MAG: hypothetical protein A2X37_12230 [Elusimicrobia bacterium GWA2_66_18]OGR76111.1 MAG: hypothetical protein A2X40_02320 [Elusimicrobia bacterium GWC2_65_9]HAZ07799.1 hypothetical protein [Elusimicrobiota bacterium]